MTTTYMKRIRGHAWTIASGLRASLCRPGTSGARRMSIPVLDPYAGPVHIGGLFFDVPDSDGLVVVVHGLGGKAASNYGLAAARAANASGLACFCIGLRGTDGSGDDLYHGGLTEDLWLALQNAQFARFRRVYLLGFSVGGHLAIKAALDRVDERVRAVAAVCPPLDLGVATAVLDSQWLYRRHIFSTLNRDYGAVANR